MAWRNALVASLLVLTGSMWTPLRADTRAFKIVDDPLLDAAVAEARAEFMRNKPFDRLDATILIPAEDGSWRRGSFNGDAVAYPASCVKLAYIAAAMHWCREHGLPYTHLDHAVRPMIEKSDNFQTGVVVDAITSAPNIDDLTSTTDPRWSEWIERRRYTARWLDERGLLGNQVILHKTYPTNSGEWPRGAEKVARDVFGKNLMQPRLSASLMLEIVKGAIEPGARDYMMELLNHDRWKSNSVLGFGLPPGSRYYNKPGLAYDTLEDIAYVVLPNGKECIVATFSNAFCPPYSSDPDPHDSSQLGEFMELLIAKTGLGVGLPPTRIVTDRDEGTSFACAGVWSDEETSGVTARVAVASQQTTPSATWRLGVPKDGKYEVCARYPARDSRTKVLYTVRHADGVSSRTVDQRKVHDRWVKLGDYQFRAGEGEITVTAAGEGNLSSTSTLAAGKVRATLWPDL
ncbi:MAG: serine hydrolase [Candidatus Sumerlaea chitinivorans]|nr:serine hydrolase [Candidatus Sumerlaea chitinivorans]